LRALLFLEWLLLFLEWLLLFLEWLLLFLERLVHLVFVELLEGSCCCVFLGCAINDLFNFNALRQ
jgi:hypothetical protein